MLIKFYSKIFECLIPIFETRSLDNMLLKIATLSRYKNAVVSHLNVVFRVNVDNKRLEGNIE